MEQSASNILTLVAPPVQTACPTWCVRHDDDADMCNGPVIELDFGDQGLDVTSYAKVQTYGTEPAGGVDLTLSLANNVNGYRGFQLTRAQARQIAAALNQAVDATEGGVR
jgi:uncharacterized protein DUF6907